MLLKIYNKYYMSKNFIAKYGKLLKKPKKVQKRKIVFLSAISASLGGLLGLLFAPKSGKETRKDIKKKAIQIEKNAEEKLKKGEKEGKELLKKMSNKVEDVVKKVSNKVEATTEEIKTKKEKVTKNEDKK